MKNSKRYGHRLAEINSSLVKNGFIVHSLKVGVDPRSCPSVGFTMVLEKAKNWSGVDAKQLLKNFAHNIKMKN